MIGKSTIGARSLFDLVLTCLIELKHSKIESPKIDNTNEYQKGIDGKLQYLNAEIPIYLTAIHAKLCN